MHDYVIVGAGLFGCVMAERIANDLGESVLVVERRNHIAGACFSETDAETGIEFHSYGTHVFHTSSPPVWEYVNRFAAFNGYLHRVRTVHRGRVYKMPINLDTINAFYNLALSPSDVDCFLETESRKEWYPNPANLEEQCIRLVGRPLYEAFVRGYTIKHWDRDPRDLPAGIINRLPVRNSHDDTYFHNARWQGIPLRGYTDLAAGLLRSPRIEVRLSTDYLEAKDSLPWRKKLVYTGPLDAYFGYGLGRLAWRSIRLNREVKDCDHFQDTSVMNYADIEIPYTRTHEPKRLHPERPAPRDKTLVFREYPGADPANPAYPINDETNSALFRAYRALADREQGLVIGGRLGEYAYYDMDQAIAAALRCYETEVRGK